VQGITSIKDIAQVAQVSHSTVSRALHHSPLVNGETGDRIREIAQRMGYRPSAIARSLVTRKTWTIGVVVVVALWLLGSLVLRHLGLG